MSGARPRLERWAFGHALLLVAAAAGAALAGSAIPIAVGAAISVGLLVGREAGRSGGRTVFGPANALTLFRWAGWAALAVAGRRASPGFLAAAGAAQIVLDAADGWIARRTSGESELGEFLDKEADAFFLLALCFILSAKGLAPGWILAPGLLRYAFVPVSFLFPLPSVKESRSAAGRIAYSAFAFSLILSALAAGRPGVPRGAVEAVLGLASLSLAGSFAVSFLQLAARVRRERRIRDLREASLSPPGEAAAIARYFDGLAAGYGDRHGDPERLLAYRIGLIRATGALEGAESILEIGCGTGQHLLALTGAGRRCLGIDLSPGMIAEARAAASALGRRIEFREDDAEILATVDDGSADVVLCVGALEHVPGKAAVFESVARVLRPGGRFVCLTPNGGSVFYRAIGPLWGLKTKYLATDRYLGRKSVRKLLLAAGLEPAEFRPWTFAPNGDLPERWRRLLARADRWGRGLGCPWLRGGLLFVARKPE